MPLVFVHGFLGGSEQWLHQRHLKFDEIITLDLPGFGLNSHLKPISRIEDFASWCLDQISKRGVDNFDLLGHSMGGMIAQEMVSQAPQCINNLILYGTGPIGSIPGRFEPIEKSKERAKEDGVDNTVSRIASSWFFKKKDDPEYLDCLAIAKKSTLESLLAGLDAMKDWSGLEKLDKIISRTLILWGDNDRSYQWDQIELLWKNIKDSQLAVVPECAHAVHLEKPEIFNLLIKEFLKINHL